MYVLPVAERERQTREHMLIPFKVLLFKRYILLYSMSPNISQCTAKEGLRTVPVLEGELGERTRSVPCVTGLLTLGLGHTLGASPLHGERGLGMLPRPPFPQAGRCGCG